MCSEGIKLLCGLCLPLGPRREALRAASLFCSLLYPRLLKLHVPHNGHAHDVLTEYTNEWDWKPLRAAQSGCRLHR